MEVSTGEGDPALTLRDFEGLIFKADKGATEEAEDFLFDDTGSMGLRSKYALAFSLLSGARGAKSRSDELKVVRYSGGRHAALAAASLQPSPSELECGWSLEVVRAPFCVDYAIPVVSDSNGAP